MVRGVSQGVLLLRDGLSLFDPYANVAWVQPTHPIETVKRIEVVTGPGGVLWGANSFLGVANVITKDAEDVNGLEISAGYGDGPGNKQDFKGYALFGKTFLNGKLKIFQHASYETLIGQVYDLPQFLVTAPGPQPAGVAYYGKNNPVDPPRSWAVVIDGKYSLGPVSLYYMLPFAEIHPNVIFQQSTTNESQWTRFDRYAVLEYKDRFLKDRFGLTVKGYGTQFVSDLEFAIFPKSPLFPPGLHFSLTGQRIFRFGGTVDADVSLPANFRILFGGESFWEGMNNSTESFIQPPPDLLPIVCPVDSSGARILHCPRGLIQDSSRIVAAGYADVQWRPFSKLTLDGGVRIQAGFGQLGYGIQPLYSGAVVWNFLPDFHLKVNYATGFRPPVFQDTSAYQGGISFGSTANLRNETSQSFQGEVNARLLKNVRKVRELELRADYSYTVLTDFIQIRNSIYLNTGKRGIHSVEGYAKLYLNGDHFLQASYTYLYSITSDSGVLKATPTHWVVLGSSFNLIKNMFDVNTNLSVFGAYEDPNRFPTRSQQMGTTTTSSVADLTFDRLTPVALLQLGFRLRFFKEKLGVSVQFYNVLNQHYYYPDIFYDLTPTLEISPTAAPGFNFFARVNYHF
jgi:iron complex outermembrane receptor protein